MTLKDKNVAGILALFLGPFGAHRFYLDQVGWGIFYLIFCWFPLVWFIAFIDAIVFFTMSKEAFDSKYNHGKQAQQPQQSWGTQPDYNRRRQEEPRSAPPQRAPQRAPQRQERAPRREPAPVSKAQELKAVGIKKFKDYDYDGAIADFEQALQLAPKDVALHFNIACAYSLNENAEKAFFHLDKAVSLGFPDTQRIKDHDALAFLRIQPGFEEFEQNGFHLTQKLPPPAPDDLLQQLSGDLLEQLNRLGDLREKGLLSEEEFVSQKKKLLG
jgi:TM2 domain-containing membrane protein YozV